MVGLKTFARVVALLVSLVCTSVGTHAAQAGDVVVNEVAWMGTAASANDEWAELFNATDRAIDLTGWTLSAQDGTPAVALSGALLPRGFFLLERTDDNTVSDISADQIYTGALGNAGETLLLKDAAGALIDTINVDGGNWPAGNNTTKATMERVNPAASDSDTNWAENTGVLFNGLDANGNALRGTPRSQNSVFVPIVPPGNTLFFVSSIAGSDTNDGLTAATALASVQRAIDRVSGGGTVRVLGGAYGTPLVINKGLTLEAFPAATLTAAGTAAVTVAASAVRLSGWVVQGAVEGIRVLNGARQVSLQRNVFVGNGVAVNNEEALSVDATDNWWGCNAGPGQLGCDDVAGVVDVGPWLVASLDVSPNPAAVSRSSTLTLDLAHDSAGAIVSNGLVRPVHVAASGGLLDAEALAARHNTPAPNVQQAGIAALSFVLSGWVLFGLNSALASTQRFFGSRTALALLFVLALTGLSGCGLLSDATNETPRASAFSLTQGVLSLTLRSPLPTAVTLFAQIDGQALSTEVRFVVEPLRVR